jgi:hypothetical protein
VGWARPHLENLGNSLLGVLRPNGFPQDHQRQTHHLETVFGQRLNGALHNVEIGFAKEHGFARSQPAPDVMYLPHVMAAEASGSAAVSGIGSYAIAVERRLSERPADIATAARALSEAISEQIDSLNASKPNEAEALARQDDFINFLQEIAKGLETLANSIDRAIAKGSGASPEAVLLGKAAENARKLGIVVAKGLEQHSAYLMDCAIKFSVFAAGFTFLHACGVDGWIAGIVGGLMNVRLSRDSKSKRTPSRTRCGPTLDQR